MGSQIAYNLSLENSLSYFPNKLFETFNTAFKPWNLPSSTSFLAGGFSSYFIEKKSIKVGKTYPNDKNTILLITATTLLFLYC